MEPADTVLVYNMAKLAYAYHRWLSMRLQRQTMQRRIGDQFGEGGMQRYL